MTEHSDIGNLRNLRGKGVSLGSQFKDTVHYGAENKNAWALSRWSDHIHNQEEGGTKTHCAQLPFSVYTVQGPASVAPSGRVIPHPLVQ